MLSKALQAYLLRKQTALGWLSGRKLHHSGAFQEQCLGCDLCCVFFSTCGCFQNSCMSTFWVPVLLGGTLFFSVSFLFPSSFYNDHTLQNFCESGQVTYCPLITTVVYGPKGLPRVRPGTVGDLHLQPPEGEVLKPIHCGENLASNI